MRTKTLLLGVATLAASLATSMAQSNVYSVNIAGYVNVVLKGGGAFTLVANPLDDGTNSIISLGAGLPNQSSIQVWNGASFNVANKVLNQWSTNTSIPPGQGFFIKTPNASADLTNTFVGNVIINSGSTNVKALQGGLVFQLVGSPVPYSGNLNDSYNVNSLNIGATLPNQSSLQTWDNSASPAQFRLANKALGFWSTNILITPGQGFFVRPAGLGTNWIQALPAAN